MTHEEFIGIKPEDGITLTEEDRRNIESTLGWQLLNIRRSMGNVGAAITDTIKRYFWLSPKRGG